MYNTSSAYKTAIRQASRPFDTVYGTVTFPVSTGLSPLTVDSSIMPTNAITISKQCIDGDEFVHNTKKFEIKINKDNYMMLPTKNVDKLFEKED